MVLILESKNFGQGAGWLIVVGRGPWGWQAAASGDITQGALGAPGSFPSHGSCGGGCCFPWASCPWWSWASPHPAGLTLLPPPPPPQEAYNAVVRYFGESPKTTPPSVFFPVFVRFIRSYKVSREGLLKRTLAERKLVGGERAGLQVWAFSVSSLESWEGAREAGHRPLSCELVGRVGAQALPVIVWARKCPSRAWPPGVAGPTDTHSPPSVSAPPLTTYTHKHTHTSRPHLS